MTPLTIDVILYILLGGFVLSGLWFGLISTLGALLGTIIGAWGAGVYYEPVSNWVWTTFHWDHNMLRVICFLVLFILINRLIGFLFYLAGRFFKILRFIPFFKSIDHLLGGIFSFIEGTLVLGLTLRLALKFPIVPFSSLLAKSAAANWLMHNASAIMPYLPKFIQNIF